MRQIFGTDLLAKAGKCSKFVDLLIFVNFLYCNINVCFFEYKISNSGLKINAKIKFTIKKATNCK